MGAALGANRGGPRRVAANVGEPVTASLASSRRGPACADTEEATGSNPVSPTTWLASQASLYVSIWSRVCCWLGHEWQSDDRLGDGRLYLPEPVRSRERTARPAFRGSAGRGSRENTGAPGALGGALAQPVRVPARRSTDRRFAWPNVWIPLSGFRLYRRVGRACERKSHDLINVAGATTVHGGLVPLIFELGAGPGAVSYTHLTLPTTPYV